MSRRPFGSNDDRSPCRPLEIVFSVDTTGSMYDALGNVCDKMNCMMLEIEREYVGTRFAAVAHGDYPDDEKTYIAKMVNFSEGRDNTVSLFEDVCCTSGGDEGECYEVALKMAREKLSWSKYSSKTLVVIGYSFPHEPDHKDNKDHIDWREETQRLADMGVTIIGVQLDHSPESASTQFFDTITRCTGGTHIKRLSDFHTIYDLIVNKASSVKKSRVLREDTEATATSKDNCETTTCTESARYRTGRIKYNRESVPDSLFGLTALGWTTWKMVFKANDDSDSNTWTKRRVGPGYKVRQLYVRSPGTYVYELSVQGNSGKKVVVFSKMTNCDPCSEKWESQLFGNFDNKQELNRLLRTRPYPKKSEERQLYIRRAEIPGLISVKNATKLLKRYDYAWSCVPGRRSSHRMLMMDNVRASAPVGFNPFIHYHAL